MIGPIGYFVHHQGRGHAERAAAVVYALPADIPITLFSARDDIFPDLPAHASIRVIPSLFEAPANLVDRPALDMARTPTTLHCAPLGWPTITRAVGAITSWFIEARPSLFITDVSAELAQLARIASIPCVPVLQHGDRTDPGHVAAYQSALGILAPYAPAIEQPDRPEWMIRKTHYAPGLGIPAAVIARAEARRKLGLAQDAEIVLVVSGGGGNGTPVTPLTIGARAEPNVLWLTIGIVEHQWHETAPGNLRHLGWVECPALYMAAADRIVSSAGDTTVHMIASAGRPWVVVPEWRYFDEQLYKARMLARAGAATVREHWPSHAGSWSAAWTEAAALDLTAQQALVDRNAPLGCAEWLTRLAAASSGASISEFAEEEAA